MIIYRLAISMFKDDLQGEGAMLYGGRWNSPGIPMLYATEHISLAVLEILVNKRMTSTFHTSFHLVQFEIPDEQIKSISLKALKKNWELDPEYTRFIGDHFSKDTENWILKVPSAVIPEEHNFLINPRHPQFPNLTFISSEKYPIDKRLAE
jgi:RES domain-containing protein